MREPWVKAAIVCIAALNMVPSFAQSGLNNSSSNSNNSNSGTSSDALTRIIPAAENAIGGGNPLQGLGRPDDSGPSRRSQFEAPDSASPSSSSSAIPGSTNPNIPPDLPPPPSIDPIDVQRDKEEKEREAEELKKQENRALEKEEAAKIPNPAIDTPMKKAMLEMHLHNYDACISQLDDILMHNPKSAEAHYLKAVAYVLTRKYGDAEKEYRLVLSNGASERLSQKARNGLAKLTR